MIRAVEGVAQSLDDQFLSALSSLNAGVELSHGAIRDTLNDSTLSLNQMAERLTAQISAHRQALQKRSRPRTYRSTSGWKAAPPPCCPTS